MSGMTAEIPAEFEQLIREAIASGKYGSEREIVTLALSLWRDREEQVNELRLKLQNGIEQLDRGEGVAADVVLRKLRGKLSLLEEQQEKQEPEQ